MAFICIFYKICHSKTTYHFSFVSMQLQQAFRNPEELLSLISTAFMYLKDSHFTSQSPLWQTCDVCNYLRNLVQSCYRNSYNLVIFFSPGKLISYMALFNQSLTHSICEQWLQTRKCIKILIKKRLPITYKAVLGHTMGSKRGLLSHFLVCIYYDLHREKKNPFLNLHISLALNSFKFTDELFLEIHSSLKLSNLLLLFCMWICFIPSVFWPSSLVHPTETSFS